MGRVGDALQLIGVTLVVVAAYTVTEALGLFVGGLAAISIGIAAKRTPDA